MLFRSLITTISLVLVLQTGTVWAGKSGRDLLLSHQCNRCHSVDAYNIEISDIEEEVRNAPDLSDAGKNRDRGFLKRFLKKEISQFYTGYHDRKFRGPEQEFDLLIDWLLSLTGKPVGGPVAMN